MQNNEILSKANALLDKINILLQKQGLKMPFAPAQKPDANAIAVKAEAVQTTKNTIQVNNQVTCNSSIMSDDKITHQKIISTFSSEIPKQLHVYYSDDNLEDKQTVEDIAVIQAFHGTNIKRILSTTKALQLMLKSRPFPADYVFVEAQTSASKASFGWLKDYGVKYIFRKYTKDSEGLLLKTALWNIGAAETKASKLCFIDSDVVMCNQDWLNSANASFENYDVISLAGYCYYEGNQQKTEIAESIGHKIMTSSETQFTGHIGFNCGMTRDAYEKYGKFEAFNRHSDVWFWQKILGTVIKKDNLGWTPYKTTDDMKYGLPLKVGSTEEVCCHIDHGTEVMNRYKVLGWISYLGTNKPFEDITYDRDNIKVLPIWSKDKVGQIIKLAFQKAYKLSKQDLESRDHKELAEELLLEAKKEVYGEIDEQHPLIVFTAFVPDFKHKDIESVFAHKEMLETYIQQPFTYVCFTNEISLKDAQERGLDVIPFSSEKVRNDRSMWKNEMYRKNVKMPKNATFVWVDFEKVINKKVEFVRN